MQIQREYNSALALLKSNITSLKNKLREQLIINKSLLEHINVNKQTIAMLDNKCNELSAEQTESIRQIKTSEVLLDQTKKQILFDNKMKIDLEKSLERAHNLVSEHIRRETMTLQKVQDALSIAESAIEEKNSVLLREQSIKDECDYLAFTIGAVMEDAAEKVETNVESVRQQYNEKIQKLEGIITKVVYSIENHHNIFTY